jgi:SpoVK/Ycf46/Vps4 family AAA+-type ATPase
MLPKLAELWDARKILYFVATNHINYFDSAIIRSHRFDALMLVSPPSFQSKVQRLTELLSRVYGFAAVSFQTEEEQIQKELRQTEKDLEEVCKLESTPAKSETEETLSARWREKKLASERALAKFALLRYDELNELAYRLALILKTRSASSGKISTEILQDALGQVADSEWRKNKSYVDYIRDTRSERRDYQMLNVWEVKRVMKMSVPGVVQANKRSWLATAVDSSQDVKIPGFQLRLEPYGRVDIRAARPK